MVKLSTLMGAKYRLKQRRKRLTHRTGHEGAHDAFAREWLRRARARNGAVPMKVRDAVDAARASKGPAELDLRGCGTDQVVEDVCAALMEHPAISKINLQKCKELTEAAGKVLVELAEAQIRLVLTMPLARQLEASAPCRRLHGVLGEGKGYTCIRRFKVDEKSIGVHHAQRLKLLERLLDYCNAKLTLRESLFTEQDDLGRPRALGGATVALDRDAARKAVLDVLERSGVKGPPPPDAFSDPVTLDKFENHCEMVLVKAKKGVLAPLGKDMVAVARDVVSRGSPRPKPPPPPGPSPRQQQRPKTPTPDISVESEEEDEAPPQNAVQALVDEDLASKVREQEAQLRELQEKLRESERRVSKAPTEDSEDDDEVPYVPAGAPLNETLKALDEQLPPGPSVEALMASKSDDVELASEVKDVKAPSPASSPGSFRDDRSWIRDDDDAAAEVVDATASPPAPPPADRSAHEERARSHVSALVEAAEAHAHETPGKFQENQEAAADEEEEDEDASDAPPVVENDALDLSSRRLLQLDLPSSVSAYAYQTLIALNVSRNRLRSLPAEAFGQLEQLESLDVSYNLLRKLELDDGSSLPSSLLRVDASRNLASSVKGCFKDCSSLKILLLSHNRIGQCDGLEHLSHLEDLDLAGNRVRACKGLRPLAGCALLRSLRLQGCPVETTGSSRALVIGLLPQLTHVDGAPLPRGRAHPTIVKKEHAREMKRLDATHRQRSIEEDDPDVMEERRQKLRAQRASDLHRSREGAKTLRQAREKPRPVRSKVRKSSSEQLKKMRRLSEDHRPQDRRSKVPYKEKVETIFGQPKPVDKPLPQPKKTPLSSTRTGFRQWPPIPEPPAVPVEVREARAPSTDSQGNVPASPQTENNFEKWMEELEGQTLTGKKAIDVVERLYADEKLRPRAAAFVGTLDDLGVLHVTPPPESVLIQCVAAPDRLRAAAAAWQRATQVADKLRTLVGVHAPKRVEKPTPPSTNPPTPSPPSSVKEEEVAFKEGNPASPIAAHPLAAFAKQLDSELTKIGVDEMPEAGLDLGASGLTPKAAPKTPSTVRASPLQTWASTAKDLQEAQPVDEGVIHAQMRRSFDAGEAASKPVEDEAAAPASPSELSAADEAPAPAAADLADAFGAAAAPQASAAPSPKASTELDSAFGAPQAAADDVNGTPSTDNASPGTTLSAREAALPTPDAADFLTSAMPDAGGADALFEDAAPTSAAEEQEQLERALAASRQDVDAAFSESSENLAAAFGAAPSPKASAEPAPSPKASGDLADAFGAASAPQASAELDGAFGAAPAEPTPKKAYLLDRIATSDGFKSAPAHQLDNAFGAAPSPKATLADAFGAAAAPQAASAFDAPAAVAEAPAASPAVPSRATSATSAARHDAAFGSPRSPRAAAPAPAPAKKAKVIWREGYDETYQRMYYFNMETGDSLWHKPDAPYKPYVEDGASTTSSGSGRTSSIGE